MDLERREFGGLDQFRSTRGFRTDLRHEGVIMELIAAAPIISWLQNIEGRKIRRTGQPCQIGIANRVHGD
jgi:hypothetical protein